MHFALLLSAALDSPTLYEGRSAHLMLKTNSQPTAGSPGHAGEVHIIEADAGVGELLVELLENQFQVKSFTALSDFKKSFFDDPTAHRPDLILCDAKLQDAPGMDVLRMVRKTDSSVPFIIMVNQPDSTWINEAFLAGVTDLLEKPFESFLFIDQFHGRIAQSRIARKQNQAMELLKLHSLLTVTHLNRLIDRAALPVQKKLRYIERDEDRIKFTHARKSEEKLLAELEECRIEYLSLAEEMQKL